MTSYLRLQTNILAKFVNTTCILFYTHSPYSLSVADPDQAFGGAVKLGGAKNVFTCLNTKGCLRQNRLSFVGQKVAIFVGRTVCTERNPQQPLLGFIKLELLYTGRNRVSTPARVPK